MAKVIFLVYLHFPADLPDGEEGNLLVPHDGLLHGEVQQVGQQLGDVPGNVLLDLLQLCGDHLHGSSPQGRIRRTQQDPNQGDVELVGEQRQHKLQCCLTLCENVLLELAGCVGDAVEGLQGDHRGLEEDLQQLLELLLSLYKTNFKF